MSRRSVLIAVAGVLVAAIGLGLYLWRFSPTNLARGAAHQFWAAVVAGDGERVAAMLAPEADFTAADVVASYREYCFGGPCGGDKPSGNVQWVRGQSVTGAEVLVVSVLRDQAGAPHPRSLAMKRVNGHWLVTRQGAFFYY